MSQNLCFRAPFKAIKQPRCALGEGWNVLIGNAGFDPGVASQHLKVLRHHVTRCSGAAKHDGACSGMCHTVIQAACISAMCMCRDPILMTDVEAADGAYKTSIVFSLPAGPGKLFRALSCFALRDVDLTKIESRPMRTEPITVHSDGETTRLNYLFYVDVLGALADKNVQNALGHLQEFAPFVRVFGSYPADLNFLKT